MVGIDDLLIACAEAMGKEIAIEVASRLVKAVTHNLATKADVARAVNEIKSFVHQEFQAAEAKAIIVDVDTVVRNIGQYQKSGDPLDLAEQETQTLLNHTASAIHAAIHSDQNYAWREFVAIARFVTANSTFWSIKVANLERPNSAVNFVDALIEGVGLLKNSMTRIRSLEDETISVFNFEHIIEKEINWREPQPGRPTYHYYNRASYTLTRGRYPGGTLRADTGLVHGSPRSEEARERLAPAYEVDKVRVQVETESRQKLIYDPLQKAIDAMNNLIPHMGDSSSGVVTQIETA